VDFGGDGGLEDARELDLDLGFWGFDARQSDSGSTGVRRYGDRQAGHEDGPLGDGTRNAMDVSRTSNSSLYASRNPHGRLCANFHLLCDGRLRALVKGAAAIPLLHNLRSALGLPPKIYSAALFASDTSGCFGA